MVDASIFVMGIFNAIKCPFGFTWIRIISESKVLWLRVAIQLS